MRLDCLRDGTLRIWFVQDTLYHCKSSRAQFGKNCKLVSGKIGFSQFGAA